MGRNRLRQKGWTIPPSRKSGASPSGPAVRPGPRDPARDANREDWRFTFFRDRGQLPLSGMAFEMLLRRISPYTAHGFRSSFRDWAGNETHFPRELAEHALAHVIGDKAEQAYRRSDALARRRELMEAWARHCEGGRARTFWRSNGRREARGPRIDRSNRATG